MQNVLEITKISIKWISYKVIFDKTNKLRIFIFYSLIDCINSLIISRTFQQTIHFSTSQLVSSNYELRSELVFVIFLILILI